MRWVLMGCIAAFFVCSCTIATMGSLSQAERDAIQTATFHGNYTAVFQAVIDVLEEGGYFITTMDKEPGVVNTEWKEGATSTTESIFIGDNVRRRVSAKVSPVNDSTCSVRLRGLIQTRSRGGWGGTETQMTVKRVRESCQKYFAQIQAKLEAK